LNLTPHERYRCITKGKAKETYMLDDADLAPLRFRAWRPDDAESWREMKLYLTQQVVLAAVKKHGSLAAAEVAKQDHAARRLDARMRRESARAEEEEMMDAARRGRGDTALAEVSVMLQRKRRRVAVKRDAEAALAEEEALPAWAVGGEPAAEEDGEVAGAVEVVEGDGGDSKADVDAEVQVKVEAEAAASDDSDSDADTPAAAAKPKRAASKKKKPSTAKKPAATKKPAKAARPARGSFLPAAGREGAGAVGGVKRFSTQPVHCHNYVDQGDGTERCECGAQIEYEEF
jgi:hypothetical protein